MKFPSAFFLPVLTIGAASAFVVPHSQNDSFSSLFMAKGNGPEKSNGAIPLRREVPKQSQSLPFMKRPTYLDGTLAGDVGFDPMGFADSKSNLMNYREAELKHGRLAMLAAAGWPLSELFDRPIAEAFGMAPILDETNRVPSVLNGGMGLVSPAYWIGCVLLAGAFDGYSMAAGPKVSENSVPGNLGFDPFGMYPKKEEDQKWMQTAEVKNGRLAMLAITGFALQEFVTHIAVVDETPFFFQPIWDTLDALTPKYTIPEGATSVLESVTTPSIDAAIVPPADVAVTTALESVAAPAIVPPADVAVTTALESIATPAAVPPIDAAAVTPAPVATAENYEEQLTDAKKRIVELESKLSSISQLTR